MPGIQKVDLGPLAPATWDQYKGEDGAFVGSEELDREPYRALPQLRLCQGTSKPVQEGKAKSGDLLHALTGENYGETVEFVPAKIAWAATLFREQQLVCASDDAKVNREGIACGDCPEAANYRLWAGGRPPECALNVVFYGIARREGDAVNSWTPVQVAFAKTSYPAGDKLRSLAKYASAPLFANVYRLGRRQRSNERNVWWVFDVERIRLATDAEVRAGFEMAKSLKGVTVPVEVEPDDILSAEGDGIPQDDAPF